MRTATLILFCATVFGAGLAHSPGGGSEKCQCREMQSVRIKHIQKLQGYPKTLFCGKTELMGVLQMYKICIIIFNTLCVERKYSEVRLNILFFFEVSQ
uniref:Chemokine interleukin-8-like domain-containing protein n=1 Tax=Oncorhynchus kisutch TaxID=8019 RepID=A0A8C7JFC9_ONCKI